MTAAMLIVAFVSFWIGWASCASVIAIAWFLFFGKRGPTRQNRGEKPKPEDFELKTDYLCALHEWERGSGQQGSGK